MDLGALFLLLGVLILIILFVSRPFSSRQPRLSAEEQTTSILMAERDRILNALQELDFDHALGKIPTEDYPSQRQALLQKGAEVLRQLDAMQPVMTVGSAEDRLEAAVASRRADTAGAQPSELNDEDLEDIIAQRRTERKDKAGGFCPACGKPVLANDSFCPTCGRPLK